MDFFDECAQSENFLRNAVMNLLQVLQAARRPDNWHHEHSRLVDLQGVALWSPHQCRTRDRSGLDQGLHLADRRPPHVRSHSLGRQNLHAVQAQSRRPGSPRVARLVFERYER